MLIFEQIYQQSVGDAAWCLDLAGTSPNDTQYGVDASTQELVELTLNSTTDLGTETDVNGLSVNSTPVSFSGSTSLDYSTASGTFYVYTAGALYSDVVSSNAVSSLGAAPGGTLAVTVAGNVSASNNGNGAGAFTPAALLPLLGMALVRRRQVRVKA